MAINIVVTYYSSIFLPYRLLKKTLQQNNVWKLFLVYADVRKKIVHNRERCRFLRACVENDIIPKFLKFRVPSNGCFDDTIVHNFQRRLLREQLSKACKDLEEKEKGLAVARNNLKAQVDVKFMPSIILFCRIDLTKEMKIVRERHQKKLQMLATEQERPLRNLKNTVKIVGDVQEPPKFVMDILALGPKHPVRDKFNKLHFLADVDKLLVDLKGENVEANVGRDEADVQNEINAMATTYVRTMKTFKADQAVLKVNKYLKTNCLKAIPFDKGAGYCLMKDTDYEKRLLDVLNCEQFRQVRNPRDDFLITKEAEFNRKLLALKKKEKITADLYGRIKSCGAQPPRLYGLAKVHKDDIPPQTSLVITRHPIRSLDRIN